MGVGSVVSRLCGATGREHGSRRDAALDVPAAPAVVTARTLGGEAYTVEVTLRDTVSLLKERLAECEGMVAKNQQRLLFQDLVLPDDTVLGRIAALAEEASRGHVELALVIVPSPHPLEIELGLPPEHPSMLREYFTKHGLKEPEWLASDSEIWKKLQEARSQRLDKRQRLDGWSHLVQLSRNGVPTALLRASPNEQVNVQVAGFIHNNKGDTCIQQLILAMDTQVAARIYTGVPQRGVKIDQAVRFAAPGEAGTYMMWRYSDLQYGMADAERNFGQRHSQVAADKYPSTFVGWLVVTAD